MRQKTILCTLLCVLSVATAFAGKKDKNPGKNADATVKVASYNICTGASRAKQLQQGKMKSEQQLWCNSYGAVAAIINDISADIIGLEEICDTIWGEIGNCGLREEIERQKGHEEYGWVLFPNTGRGTISYDVAIGFKLDRFKLMDSDIFWMGGIPEEPKAIEGRKGCNRPCVWVKLKDRITDKTLFLACTHLVLESVPKMPGGNLFNAQECIKYLDEVIIPKDAHSFIVGDFNCASPSAAYKEMVSRRWADTYDFLEEQGKIEENESMAGTQPLKDESGFGKWRPDHILFYKMTPNNFHIDRRKFPTLDGTDHFPSDHLPIIAEFSYGK